MVFTDRHIHEKQNIMKYDNYPVIKVLLPYIIGIVIAYKFDFQKTDGSVILFSAVVFVAAAFIVSSFKSYRLESVQLLLVMAAFVAIGMVQTNRKYTSFAGECGFEGDFVVRLMSGGTPGEKSERFEAEILFAGDSAERKGRALLYFRSGEKARKLAYGDVVTVRARLERIEQPHNPEAFNYAGYMRRRGVCFTGFVREEGFEKMGHSPESRILEIANETRRRCVSLYESAGMTGDELGILKAILLGDDDTLDSNLKKSYSSAGVSHILCVSGMHVGIIFMIINFLLKPLDYSVTTRIFKSVVTTAVVWAYAHVTGLAPSVTRAAAMFTFVAAGQALRRNTDVFHSLFASLFILLVHNPLLLFETGFQLSYLAVFGIVLFQPKISGIFKFKTKVAKYFWELLTVSVAAQIGTSPIAIYYFSQFPNYFMLSNLCVMALSFVVVVTGVLLLPFSMLPVAGRLLSRLLTAEIRVMNAIITFIERLPFSVTENIDYTVFQVVVLYATVGCVCSYIHRKKRLALVSACVFLSVFSLSFPVKKAVRASQEGFTAYHIRGSTALGFFAGGKCYILSDSVKCVSDRRYEYNIRAHVRKRLLEPVVVGLDTLEYTDGPLVKRGRHVAFMGQRYMIVDKEFKREYSGIEGLETDCVIIRGNPWIKPEELAVTAVFKEVVVDGSNNRHNADMWRDYCVGRGIPVCVTGERFYE